MNEYKGEQNEKFFYSLFLTLSLGISTSAFAKRIYINAKDVMVAENGIIVNLNGYAEMVDAIYYDENGIFFEPKVAWMCANGHYVSGTTTRPKCGDKQRR
ncbi:hypothetical protein [Candidatus Protochlamydia phocaeensis]|uniref:hypothetical protein n=1 Tax=Candidatus Protochlamydia phocaeensis TaxID=1414722 RepID=UPI000A80AEAD|nr:hypothetical protein [Candidatus Protochlamydia phocaeensis]